MNKKLLLAIQYVCSTQGPRLPWNEIGKIVGNKRADGRVKDLSEGAITQHLAKMRIKMIDAGEDVPPPLRKGGGLRSTKKSKGSGPNESQATELTDDEAENEEMLEESSESDAELGEPSLHKRHKSAPKSKKGKEKMVDYETASDEEDSKGKSHGNKRKRGKKVARPTKNKSSSEDPSVRAVTRPRRSSVEYSKFDEDSSDSDDMENIPEEYVAAGAGFLEYAESTKESSSELELQGSVNESCMVVLKLGTSKETTDFLKKLDFEDAISGFSSPSEGDIDSHGGTEIKLEGDNSGVSNMEVMTNDPGIDGSFFDAANTGIVDPYTFYGQSLPAINDPLTGEIYSGISHNFTNSTSTSGGGLSTSPGNLGTQTLIRNFPVAGGAVHPGPLHWHTMFNAQRNSGGYTDFPGLQAILAMQGIPAFHGGPADPNSLNTASNFAISTAHFPETTADSMLNGVSSSLDLLGNTGSMLNYDPMNHRNFAMIASEIFPTATIAANGDLAIGNGDSSRAQDGDIRGSAAMSNSIDHQLDLDINGEDHLQHNLLQLDQSTSDQQPLPSLILDTSDLTMDGDYFNQSPLTNSLESQDSSENDSVVSSSGPDSHFEFSTLAEVEERPMDVEAWLEGVISTDD